MALLKIRHNILAIIIKDEGLTKHYLIIDNNIVQFAVTDTITQSSVDVFINNTRDSGRGGIYVKGLNIRTQL
jgi:hypothetical protein